MAPFTSSKRRLDGPGPIKKLFTREPHLFKFHRTPTISVSAPQCGPSGEIGNLNALSSTTSPAELFPTLTWHFERPESVEDDDGAMESEKKTKEYLILVEDLDGALLPSSTPPLLGIYYKIPRSTARISGTDLVKTKKGRLERITVANRELIGGFKYGVVDGKVWRCPKALHRVHFQVVALSKTVDAGDLSEHPTKASFRGAVEGKVLGWGEWVGVFEKS